ncbi:MAG: hypothetical protein RLZZ627_2053, partial [Pseudomonadota bacterium]
GSGRPNPEIDVVLADALQIVLLVKTPGPNHTPPGFENRGTGCGFAGQQRLNIGVLKREMDAFRRNDFFRTGHKQALDHALGRSNCPLVTQKRKFCAAIGDLDSEAPLDLAQVLIKLAA